MTDGSAWRWSLASPPVLVALLGLGAHPVLSPDAVELAMAGRCLVGGGVAPALCVGTEPWFWPPGFPLLIGAPALAIDPAVAALLGGLLAYGLLGAALARLGQRLAGPSAALLAPLLLLAVPTLRAHALMGDARGLALALLFAGAVASLGATGRRGFALAGLCLGAAVLTREESVGAAAAVGVVALARSRAAWPVLPVAAGVAAPWSVFLSLRAGRLVPTSRSWQGAAGRWVDAFPRQWVFAELSAGSRGTPLRTMLSTSAATGTGDPPSLAAAGAWVAQALPATVPWPVAALAAVGLGVLWARGRRAAVATLAALAVPALLVAALPAARDPILPANNLLVVHVAACLLAAVALAEGLRRLPRPARTPTLGAIAGGVLLGAATLGPFPLFAADRRPPPRALAAAATWLAERPPGTGAGSLVGATPLHRAGWTRVRLPPPTVAARSWAADPPDVAVVTSLDQPDHALTVRLLLDAGAQPVAHLEHGGDAVTLWSFARLPTP